MLQLDELCLPRFWTMLAVLARAGGFAALAPTVAVHDRAVRPRLLLAIALAMILIPFVAATSSDCDGSDWMGSLISELATGLVIGFALRALLTGIVLAAQLIDQQLGFPCATELEDEMNGTALGRLFQLIALALFISMGGHRLVVAGLLDAPAAWEGVPGDAHRMLDRIAGLLMEACWLAVRVAAPVVLALITSSLTVAMIARLLPQLGSPVTALPAQVALGLVLVFLWLAALPVLFSDVLDRVLNWVIGGGG